MRTWMKKTGRTVLLAAGVAALGVGAGGVANAAPSLPVPSGGAQGDEPQPTLRDLPLWGQLSTLLGVAPQNAPQNTSQGGQQGAQAPAAEAGPAQRRADVPGAHGGPGALAADAPGEMPADASPGIRAHLPGGQLRDTVFGLIRTLGVQPDKGAEAAQAAAKPVLQKAAPKHAGR
ncbi:hypothetical protein [Actinomadura atramentaria]|uniref:hypothetical protein n=1 Tax=Actinomadura atramentaria TaxID=1990 RepID=UPI00039F8644|nr:hypothetical protein [Actinomadura atramentaria]